MIAPTTGSFRRSQLVTAGSEIQKRLDFCMHVLGDAHASRFAACELPLEDQARTACMRRLRAAHSLRVAYNYN
jgi:hypothetical protein